MRRFYQAPQQQLAPITNPYSQAGQNLDAGDWNALRDYNQIHQNDNRPAATPFPWQATYYNQQPQTQVHLTQGEGDDRTTQNIGIPAGVVQDVTRRFATPQQPSFSRFGNTLYVNGRHVTDDLSGYASQNNQTVDQYMPGLVQRRQAMWPQTYDALAQMAKARQSLRSSNPELTGMQQGAVIQQAFNGDEDSYARNLQAAIKGREAAVKERLANEAAAQKLEQDAAAFPASQEHAALQNADLVVKSIHPRATTQGFLTTYNMDPAHPNQFRIDEEDIFDPITGAVTGKRPAQWVTAQDDVAKHLQGILPQGYSGGMSIDQRASMQGRLAALEVERNKPSPDEQAQMWAQEPGNEFVPDPAQPGPAVPAGGAAAGARGRAAILPALGWAAGTAGSGLVRADSMAHNAEAEAVNRAWGFFGGRSDLIPKVGPDGLPIGGVLQQAVAQAPIPATPYSGMAPATQGRWDQEDQRLGIQRGTATSPPPPVAYPASVTYQPPAPPTSGVPWYNQTIDANLRRWFMSRHR